MNDIIPSMHFPCINMDDWPTLLSNFYLTSTSAFLQDTVDTNEAFVKLWCYPWTATAHGMDATRLTLIIKTRVKWKSMKMCQNLGHVTMSPLEPTAWMMLASALLELQRLSDHLRSHLITLFFSIKYSANLFFFLFFFSESALKLTSLCKELPLWIRKEPLQQTWLAC